MLERTESLIGGVLLAVALLGCGGSSGGAAATASAVPSSSPQYDSAKAQQTCVNTEPDSRFHLIAAFDSTAGTVATWQERPGHQNAGGKSQWRDHPASAHVVSCWYDTDSGTLAPPLPSSPGAEFDRECLLVADDGVVRAGPMGNRNSLQVERPY